MKETLSLDGSWQVIFDHGNKDRTLNLQYRENSIATRTWSRSRFLHDSKNSSKIMKASSVMEKPSIIGQKYGATAKQQGHMKVDASVSNFKSMTS